MDIEEIKELRKLLPCRMIVWDYEEEYKIERIVTHIFNNGSCCVVSEKTEKEFCDGDNFTTISFTQCKPIPKKTTQPMNHAEINRWWWDNVRAGRNPAWYQSGATFFTPPFSGIFNGGDMLYCADYTGSDTVLFEPLTTEVNE
jgi:hypothetical protein